MKFCYVDESGTGDEPFAVMAGLIVDAYSMRVTKAEWEDHFAMLCEMIGKPVQEFHTRDFYAVNRHWRDIPGEERSNFLTGLFDWLTERPVGLVYSAVDKRKFSEQFNKLELSVLSVPLW